ncbi:MAG: HIT domain-containing protein [bacterium]
MLSEKPKDCVFCTMLAEDDDEKNRILHRAEFNFVVINAYPYTNGHIMVVCNRHVDSFAEMTGEERGEMAELVAVCEKAIADVYNPAGINVGANIGESAGAGILHHLHMHLLPRWYGDSNFMTSIGETRVISEDLTETYKRLKPRFE